MFADQTYTISFDLSVITDFSSVSLEVFTGGQGFDGGTTSLYGDGVYVGELTDGDESTNYARLDNFDLTSILSYFEDGEITLTFDTESYRDGYLITSHLCLLPRM